MNNFFGIPHPRPEQPAEQNIQQVQSNLYIENAVEHMLSMQRSSSMTIFDSPTSPTHSNHHFADSFVDLNRVESSYLSHDDNEITSSRNQFTNFMQLDLTPAEAAILFRPEERVQSPLQIGASQSICALPTALPLLEMGFSMQHVRRAMDATGTNIQIKSET